MNVRLSKNKMRYEKDREYLTKITIRLPVGLDLLLERIAQNNNTSKSVVIALMLTLALKTLGSADIDFNELMEDGSTII